MCIGNHQDLLVYVEYKRTDVVLVFSNLTDFMSILNRIPFIFLADKPASESGTQDPGTSHLDDRAVVFIHELGFS